ncbi:MAG: chromosome segregation protein SMC, partial [Halobacteriaceae archaeon]
IPDIDGELDDLQDELDKARQNLNQIEDVVEDLKQEKQEAQRSLDEVEDDLSAAQEEYARLEANAADSGDSSFGQAVTTILKSDIDGVHGPIAQLGGVEEQYATACETAAGGRMAHVVVDDDGVGQRCIEYLKRRNAGRATFLPIDKMDDRSLPSLPEHEGVIDFAYNLVEFDGEYSPIFSYVLGDTLVVDNMDSARDLMGQFRMVTLSGELIETSGAMTGGSHSGSRYSFSNTEGKLERVAERISSLKDRKQDLRSEIRDIDDRLDSARDRKSDASDQVRSIKAEIEQLEGERSDTEERITELEERLSELESEREQVDEEMQAIEEEIAEKRDTIAGIEDD